MAVLIKFLHCSVMFAALACFGQTETAPQRLHTMEETAVSSLPINSRGFRAVCGDGNFYVQTGPGQYMAVDLKGQTHTALDTSKVPASESLNPKDLFVVDMAPNPRGGVIATVEWEDSSKKDHSGILRFDEHGDYDGMIPLDAGFTPTHIAEFSSSGGFIVTGYDERNNVHVALINGHGQVLVPQVLSHDDAEVVTGMPTAKQMEHATAQTMMEAGLIRLVSGDDDAVYLFNPSRGRKVIRIRPSGQFSEMVLPAAPSSGGRVVMPLELVVSHGNIYFNEAVLDEGQKQEDVTVLKHFALSVYNRYDGTMNASFQIDDAFGATLVGVAPKEFYFLNAKVLPGGISFSIVRAAP